MGSRFVQLYDGLMWPIEKMSFHRIRKEITGQAKGRVLEVGSGTGLNFPYYRSDIQVDAVDPDPMMRIKSLERLKKLDHHFIRTHLTGAERLPFPDQTFDTVIGTLVFCTIPDPEKAIAELFRVSKPEASVYLFEHVEMDDPRVAKIQQKVTPYWKKVCGGCHLDRNTLRLMEQSDFTVTNVTSYYNGLFLWISCVRNYLR